MRFGERLHSLTTPEWKHYYLAYEALKEALYHEQSSEQQSTDEESFLSLIHEELQKVDLFYNARVADVGFKYQELKAHVDNLLLTDHRPENGNVASSGLLPAFLGSGDMSPEQACKLHITSLKDALSELYLHITLLQRFKSVNLSGFRKICKKHDKVTQSQGGMDFYRSDVLKARFCQSEYVTELLQEIELVFAHDLEGGDMHQAMKVLRVPGFEEKFEMYTLFRLGLWIGLFVACSVVAAFFVLTEVPLASFQAREEALRLFRASFMPLLMAFCVGVNFSRFRALGVNHTLLFDLNRRDHISGYKIMEISAFLLACWVFSVLVYVGMVMANVHVYTRLAVPLTFALVLVSVITCPLPLMNLPSRKWLVQRMIRVVCAPFYPLTFVDCWLADQLYSVLICLVDLQYMICFFCYDWGNETLSDKNEQCGNVYATWPVVAAAFPVWVGFAQSLRQWRDTGGRRIHLFGAGKSTMTFLAILFAALVEAEKADHGGKLQLSTLFVAWVTFSVVSTIYTFYWDMRFDWGLNVVSDGKITPRREMIYSRRTYYLAVVGNAIMSIAWTVNLSVGEGGLLSSEGLRTALAIVEVLRRFLWNFFTVEYAHLANVDSLRAVRDIPVVPLSGLSHVNGESRKDR